MAHRVIVRNEAPNTNEKKDVKNKFRWDWLDQKVEDIRVGDVIRKIDEDGYVKCICCAGKKLINYGTSGSAYAVSSDFYNLEVLTQDAIKQIFRKEVLTVCTPGKEMGMWQMHALSSIFRRPLVSVYPKIEGDWLSEYGNEGPQRQDLPKSA